jgi:carbonic anhydrase
MKRPNTSKRFQDFLDLRDQARLISKDSGPLSLWIACTDHAMDPVLERIAKKGSAVFLRQAKFEVPASKAELRDELSAINFAVERLNVQDIVVCGHSLCSWFPDGPIKGNQTSPSGNLDSLWQRVTQREAMNEGLQKHLIHQLQILETYPSVINAMQARRLRTHGLFYLAESGIFSYYDRRNDRFADCDETPNSY